MSTFTCTAANDLSKLCTGYRNYSYWRTNNSAAVQGWYAGHESTVHDNRIGIIVFDGLASLKGNRINSISLSITCGGAGGSWTKNLIIRKSMIQGLIDRSTYKAKDYSGDLTNADKYKDKILNPDSGKTCYDYDSNILGILSGKFKSNTVTHTLSDSSNSNLFTRMKEYIESGNDAFVIYNADVSNIYEYEVEAGSGKYSYEYLGITSITITVNYSVPYTITLNAGSGYFDGDASIKEKTLTKWEGTDLEIPSTIDYTPVIDSKETSFTIIGKTGLDIDINQIATKRQVFSFNNWNTESAGYGTSHLPGSNYTTNSDATLYAIYDSTYEYENNIISGSEWWDIEKGDVLDSTYTVSFDGNEGTCSTDPLSARKITSYALDGWYSNENGAGTKYNNSSEFTSEIELYANWSSTTDTESIILPGYDTVTRKGYEFIHWNSSKSGNGTKLIPGTEYTPTASMTLYAIYEVKGLARIYDNDGYREALTWVFDGTEWVQAIPYTFDGTSWRIGG